MFTCMSVSTRACACYTSECCASPHADTATSRRSLTHSTDATGAAWQDYTEADFIRLGCTPQEAFTRIFFDHADTYRSYLGGLYALLPYLQLNSCPARISTRFAYPIRLPDLTMARPDRTPDRKTSRSRRNGPCMADVQAQVGWCVETQTETTPQEILITNVGVAPTGEVINMRITNETECKRFVERSPRPSRHGN